MESNPSTSSHWRVTLSNPVRETDGLDFERCAALHNELFLIGRAGAAARDEPRYAFPENTSSLNWFDIHGDEARSIRDRLSPSLCSFLERAIVQVSSSTDQYGDECNHSFFYFAGGLHHPDGLWRNHEMFADDRDESYPDRFLTLYAATNFASHPDGLV